MQSLLSFAISLLILQYNGFWGDSYVALQAESNRQRLLQLAKVSNLFLSCFPKNIIINQFSFSLILSNKDAAHQVIKE